MGISRNPAGSASLGLEDFRCAQAEPASSVSARSVVRSRTTLMGALSPRDARACKHLAAALQTLRGARALQYFMTTKVKNLIVGVSVLIGMGMLGWMILEFGGVMAKPFAGAQKSVTLVSTGADGISAGSAVLFLGVNVGQVVDVTVSDDLTKVVMHARLNAAARVPANVHGVIRSQSLISGNNALFLETTGAPQGTIADNAELTAAVGEGSLLPKEFTTLAEELRLTSRQFRESNVIARLDETLAQTTKQLAKAGEVMEATQKLIADPAMKKDLHEAIANVKDVTESAKRVTAGMEKFVGTLDTMSAETLGAVKQAKTTFASTEQDIHTISKQLGERLTQVAGILDSFQAISQKIDKGQGTAGLLVNDPKLYESLVDSAKQMNLVMTDLKRLAEQWEQEGVTLKLK